MNRAATGRNDPCLCGSGRKYKTCCGQLTSPAGVPRWGGPDPPNESSAAELHALGDLLAKGEYQELETRARALLRLQARSGFGWQLLGTALDKQGKDALEVWTTAVQYLPGDPVGHLNLGNALRDRGRLLEAATAYARALDFDPAFAEAHSNLADLQLELGRVEAAADSCRQALKLRPEFAEAHQILSKTAARLGDHEQAVASARRAIQIRPGFAEAHNTLGNGLLMLSRSEEAMTSFRCAIRLRPAFAEAHANLAGALRSVGRLDAAVSAYRRALELRPDFLRACIELATALRLQRRTAESTACCHQALQIAPGSAAAIEVLAQLQADHGQFAQAETLFRSALEVDPDLAEAWVGLARVRRMRPEDAPWLEAVQGLMQRGLPPRRELSLRYAMGKYFDDLEQFAAAFNHYRRANELSKRCGPPHDRARLQRGIDLIVGGHNAEWFRRVGDGASSSPRPVFIVGMLRSGTTLAEQILAAHPQVHGAGELTFWSSALAAVLDRPATDDSGPAQPGRIEFARLGDEFLAELHGLSPAAARVVDKMPTNFLSLGLIHAALPNARIIHMQRNPLDTCLSIYFQQFESANTYANDLDDLAHYLRQYQRLMQHWKSVLPGNAILDVPYEGLVSNLEGWSRRMLAFIGLPWDPRCLEFHETSRSVVTASRWQVRQKVNTDSVARWRHYRDFVGPLKSLQSGAD